MSFLALLALYLILKALLLAVGVGVGVLLRWVVPSVDLGSAILIGVVATLGSLHLFAQLLRFVEPPETDEDDLPGRVVLYPIRAPRQRKKRKTS